MKKILFFVLIVTCLPLRASPEIGKLESTTGIGSIYYSCESNMSNGDLGLNCEFSQTTVTSAIRDSLAAASFVSGVNLCETNRGT